MFHREKLRFALASAFLLPLSVFSADGEQASFFETKVRPLLAEHCQECHNADDQQGGLRLDVRAGVFGSIGKSKVVEPGQPDQSRLIAVVRYNANDIQMPPDGELSDELKAVLSQWVATGAYWPEGEDAPAIRDPFPRREDGTIDFTEAASRHWAYQPIQRPNVPEVPGARIQSPIDAFVAQRLASEGLKQSPQADRHTLLRRMSFDTTGLPPTYAQVDEFTRDTADSAIERQIDRLLESPHFGERWARHWLDVARYADTTGYRTADKSTEYPNAYTYRDWVVQALNSDMPYDQFVTAQIAADHFYADNPYAQAALGFLSVGPVFIDNREEQINDQIDVVTRGIMGMTATCARCHDHKFDPVPTSDYYSLYGVFSSTQEVPNGTEIPVSEVTDGLQKFRDELKKLEDAHHQVLVSIRDRIQEANREQTEDYLVAAATEADLLPKDVRPKGEPELRGRSVSRWRDFLRGQRSNPIVRVIWHLSTFKDKPDFQAAVREWAAARKADPKPAEFSPEFVEVLAENPPNSLESAIRRLGQKMQAGQAPYTSLFDINPAPTSFAAEQIREVSDRDLGNEITASNKKIDEHWAKHPDAPPRAMAVRDGNPHDVQVFIRGNSGRRGDVAPRRFPQVLYSASNERFTGGSGRGELAKAIVHAENPLTARVIVNRVWAHYFGRGLVITRSDFGTQGEPPSHPELLDWLAAELIAHNWSLKWLHREILRSATYQQSSLSVPAGRAVDPENVLLWRQNRRRLEFEPLRDSMLSVAGMLDERLGGKAAPTSNLSRRTLYLKVDRNNPPELFRTFDVPDTEQSSPGRAETTVPQQALFLLNNGAINQITAGVIKQLGEAPADEAVRKMFRRVLSRDPTAEESAAIRPLFETDRAAAAQALLMSNEFAFVD